MKSFSMFLVLIAVVFSTNASAYNPPTDDGVACANGTKAFTGICRSACHESFVDGKSDNATACSTCRGGVTLISAGLSMNDAIGVCKDSDLGAVCVAGAVGAALACGQTAAQ